MDAQVIRDIENKYVQTQADLQNVKAQIAAQQRTIKLSDATEKQLSDAVKDDGTIWQGVGKMFISTSVKDYKKVLEEEKRSSKESLEALNKKLRYLEQTFENLTSTITQISNKLQEQSPAK